MKLTDTNVDRVEITSAKGRITDTKIADLEEWRKELDEYYLEMQNFVSAEPDEIFMRLSGYTSRVSYIRSVIMRSSSRMLQAFRTGEIDPFITECDRQFKFWSRVASVYQVEASMNGKVT